MSKKIQLTIFLLLLLLALTYGVWRMAQPVQVDAIHKDGSHSNILVTHFPFTDRGRIEWWEKNKARLITEYGIPEPDNDGDYTVLFWAWDGVYRKYGSVYEDSDLRCFEDKKDEARCIIKSDIPLHVSRSRHGRLTYYIGRSHSAVYSRKTENDKLERKPRDY